MPIDDEGVYIKVYVEKLRALAKEAGLTRAELGELVLIALHINAQNICHPGNDKTNEDIGRTARNNARRLRYSLREKGVLTWTDDPKVRSHVYRIPAAFSFGSSSYQSRNTYPRGGTNSYPRGGIKSDPRGGTKSDPEQDPYRTRSNKKKIQTEQEGRASGPLRKQKPDADPRDLTRLMRSLLDAGVRDREAYLIPRQYDKETVQEVINLAATEKNIKGRGAWIRTVIERKTGQKLKYPDSSANQGSMKQAISETFHIMVKNEAEKARRLNIYTADPYFDDDENEGQNGHGRG